MVDKLDWTVLLKETDPLEETEEDSEAEVDSAEEEEVDSEEDSVVIITQETKATLQLSLVRMIRTPKRAPSELSLERKFSFDE